MQKGFYRFLHNEKVSEDILIGELCQRSAQQCKDRHVLCIQDTTEVNLSSQKHRIKENSGLGRLDGAKPALGFKMHSTLMLDAGQKEVLGFSDVNLWHRPSDMPDRKERKYQQLPIEQKESYKWIKAATKSKERLVTARMITFIEDREGDIYEQLSSLGTSGVHYIIRSKSNRNTDVGLKAWDIVAAQNPTGKYTINLPTDHRKKRKKELVILNVRYASITLCKGHHLKNAAAYPDAVRLNIVEAYEEKQKGISWKLFTTHDVKNFEDAYQIVSWYSQRWMIEQVHRLLKSQGFQIEDSELESGWAIRKLCILMLSAVQRIIQMNMVYSEPGDGQTTASVFSEQEIQCLELINRKVQGKTAKQKNNNNQQSLKWATWVVARLGGWTGYESQGPPGIIILKRGLEKFNAIYFGWSMAKDVGTR